MLPDFDRADRIGEFWSYPQSRTFAELLIDCEEDRTLLPVLVKMLRELTALDSDARGRSLLSGRTAALRLTPSVWEKERLSQARMSPFPRQLGVFTA
jgi:hypothetical protein